MTVYKLTLFLEEPMTCGAQRMIGNQAPSLDYIPATVLRGAVAAVLARKGDSGRIASLFGGPSPRWSPAWPVSEEKSEAVVPMPLSFLRVKGDDGFEGALGGINVLRTDRPSDAAAYRELFKEASPSDIPEKIQWVRMAPGWLRYTTAATEHLELGTMGSAMNSAMFHGSDYLMGAARESWLFSREAVSKATRFVAHVVDDHDVIKKDINSQGEGITEVYLGKRITAGNGRAILTWSVAEEGVPWATHAPDGDTEVTIQLMTPAIIPALHGGFLSGLDEKAWCAILGDIPVELKKVQSEADAVHGWITAWDLPRERYPAVAAGSCFLLKLRDQCKTNDFHAALKKLVTSGLGIRTGEGFGWVAVSPPWLSLSHARGRNTANAQRPGKLPADQDTITQDTKRQIIKAAYLFNKEDSKVGQKAAELAAIADRVDSVEQLNSYLNGLAARKNPRQWNIVQNAWEKHGNNLQDLTEMRYFLTWAKNFAVKDAD